MRQVNVRQMIKKKATGSITIETAFSFPIFLFAFIALCYLFVFIKTEYTVQRELYYTAREVSSYGPVIEPLIKIRDKFISDAENTVYGEENKTKSDIIRALTSLLPDGGNGISIGNIITNSADSLIFRYIMQQSIPEEVFQYIKDGKSGINCDGSLLYDIDKCLIINCSYSLKLPMNILPDINIPVNHSIKFRYFSGTEVRSLLTEVEQDEESGENEDEEEEDDVEYVLITDTGGCYHFSYSCPSLNIRPTEINLSDVGKKRNAGGGKYKPCEFCVRNSEDAVKCYITPEGDRYHFDKMCQGLKRTIDSVPITEVGKRRACKRCLSMREEK